jgi:two-component system phosphate regulon response regulator PhoB
MALSLKTIFVPHANNHFIGNYKKMEKVIYLVEDDLDIRELIEYILMKLNVKVMACASAEAFKQRIKFSLPDLIILDVMLPDGNGIDICAGLKSDAATSHVPVLLMSANLNNKSKAGDFTAEEFISKPFDINELQWKVKKLLN